MPTPARTSVFISYSHADTQWRELLLTHLRPLIRDYKVEVWSDKDIRKGERWRDRINRQLAKARVAIFLVSADFLASDFIHAAELPPLLAAAEREGAVLLSVIVRPCAFRDSPLSSLQAVNNPAQPLSGLTKTQREHAMLSVYNELRALFKSTPPTAKKTAATKPTPKPAAKPAKKLMPKPTAKATPKTAAKPVPKTSAKPAAKPATKPAPKAPTRKAAPRAKK